MRDVSDGPVEDLPPSATTKIRRDAFAAKSANGLAEQVEVVVGDRRDDSRARSSRFVWYQDDVALTLVVGEQEAGHADEALAVGLAECDHRELRLVLPDGWHEPTLHRWAWLRDLPMSVWSHHGNVATPLERPTKAQTLATVRSAEKPQLHLADRTPWVESLMRWAGEQPDLDPSHRSDVRAWQCRGQRVLRIERKGAELRIVAGIDWGASSPHQSPEPLSIAGPLTDTQESSLKDLVSKGCQERLTGLAHRADEHWMQAVLRRKPQVLGLEQPVLREVAAWRPSGSRGTRQTVPRGRGFVDLAGLDATGTVLLVETKLGGDHMLVLQGLDYRIWAEANRERLTSRLDCRTDTPFEMAYCVGVMAGGVPGWSPYTAAHLSALAPDVRWHVQEVTGWTDGAPQAKRGPLRTYPLPEVSPFTRRPSR